MNGRVFQLLLLAGCKQGKLPVVRSKYCNPSGVPIEIFPLLSSRIALNQLLGKPSLEVN